SPHIYDLYAFPTRRSSDLAEIIIEGTVLPNVRDEEGPFGEVSGYYTPSNPKPIIEVSAITHRKNPIYQAALTGMPTTENHILKRSEEHTSELQSRVDLVCR